MSKNKKEKLYKVPTILNAFLFVFSGFTFIGSNKILFGIIQIVAGSLNLILLPNRIPQKTKTIFSYLVFVFNIIVAVTISIDYFNAGKEYIQYVWIVVALISLFALIKYHLKSKSNSMIN